MSTYRRGCVVAAAVVGVLAAGCSGGSQPSEAPSGNAEDLSRVQDGIEVALADFHREERRYPETLTLDMKQHQLSLGTIGATRVVMIKRAYRGDVDLGWYADSHDLRVGKVDRTDEYAGAYSFCLSTASAYTVISGNPLGSQGVEGKGACPKSPGGS